MNLHQMNLHQLAYLHQMNLHQSALTSLHLHQIKELLYNLLKDRSFRDHTLLLILHQIPQSR